MSDDPDDSADVLLVEDNADDVHRLRDSFAELNLDISIDVAADGTDALALLTDRADDPSSLPDLVLLDLEIPRMNGLELLEAISEDREDQVLERLPILVLTRSASVEDVSESYDLAANAYLSKPTDEAGYDELVTAVADFWFRRAVLPTAAL
ncbi:response regulator [Natrinema sp. 74]|uniref:response regulator n=1 Tax=Natrinema sp. 74 TaxID=3384159 RepID=UPI0038D3961A